MSRQGEGRTLSDLIRDEESWDEPATQAAVIRLLADQSRRILKKGDLWQTSPQWLGISGSGNRWNHEALGDLAQSLWLHLFGGQRLERLRLRMRQTGPIDGYLYKAAENKIKDLLRRNNPPGYRARTRLKAALEARGWLAEDGHLDIPHQGHRDSDGDDSAGTAGDSSESIVEDFLRRASTSRLFFDTRGLCDELLDQLARRLPGRRPLTQVMRPYLRYFEALQGALLAEAAATVTLPSSTPSDEEKDGSPTLDDVPGRPGDTWASTDALASSSSLRRCVVKRIVNCEKQRRTRESLRELWFLLLPLDVMHPDRLDQLDISSQRELAQALNTSPTTVGQWWKLLRGFISDCRGETE